MIYVSGIGDVLFGKVLVFVLRCGLMWTRDEILSMR